MARFRYTAKSMDGKTKRGTMEALTENAMIQELKSQGLFLVEAKNLTETRGYKSSMRNSWRDSVRAVNAARIRSQPGACTGILSPIRRESTRKNVRSIRRFCWTCEKVSAFPTPWRAKMFSGSDDRYDPCR